MITAMTLAPLVAAILIIALPAQRARAVALAGALVSFALIAWMLVQFNNTLTGLQFKEFYKWIPDLEINYHVALDGTNALVLLLAALLAPIVVLISWGHNDRPKTYFSLLSLQFTGLFGTFTALNFFHWFIYWELALVPAFFLIKLFGKSEDRHKAAINFFLFTVLGSVAMLLGFLFLYQETKSFSFIDLPVKVKSIEVSSLIFVAILAGLWVKVPLAPLHIWQAPTYAAAPTPVVIMLTGVMSKMGVYGFLRLVVPIFPEQLKQHADMLLSFALLTILWGAFLALRQTDLKKLLAFSSLNHVAYCILGIGALGVTAEGLKIDSHGLAKQGVILQMFAHGLSAAGLFYLIGLLEQRAGTRDRDEFGGLCSVTPRFAAMFYILTFCSLGLPFLAGFAAEFLIFSGSFAVAPKVTSVATLGLLATAVFLLTMLQRVFTGPVKEQHQSMQDLTKNEILILTPILILIFWAGVYPKTWLVFSQLIQP